MKSGIYKIENQVNGKVYIGSSIDLKKREKKHMWMLKKNIHHNRHLQHSFNNYGEKNFEFKIMCNIEKELLSELESLVISEIGIENIYNLCKDGRNNYGIKRSKETKKKLSISTTKWINSVEKETQKMWAKLGGLASGGFKGKHTEKTKIKMSDSAKKRFSKIEEIEKAKKRSAEKSGKKIEVYIYKTNEYVGTYDSIRDCARQLNIVPNRHGIKYCLDKKYSQCKGYFFSYLKGGDKNGSN